MLIIFIVSTSIHLYASWKQNQSLRNKSKPIILLSLLGFYCFTAKNIHIFVVLALLFSWLGDICLMQQGKKWFTLGGSSFLLSHIFYILSYAFDTDFSVIPKVFLFLLPIAFILIVANIFEHLKPYLSKELFYPMSFYLFVNGMMNCFAWFRSFSSTALTAWITSIGALLFFISDTTLFFVRFKKDSLLQTHFIVMLTYAIGEFLIVLGLILA